MSDRQGTPLQAIRYALTDASGDGGWLRLWYDDELSAEEDGDFLEWCAAHPDETEEEGR